MSILEQFLQNCTKFYCPANKAHILSTHHKYLSHLTRCKELQGKPQFVCQFADFHRFMQSDQRSKHEDICEFNVSQLSTQMEQFNQKDKNANNLDKHQRGEYIIGKYKNDFYQSQKSNAKDEFQHYDWYIRNKDRLKQEKEEKKILNADKNAAIADKIKLQECLPSNLIKKMHNKQLISEKIEFEIVFQKIQLHIVKNFKIIQYKKGKLELNDKLISIDQDEWCNYKELERYIKDDYQTFYNQCLCGEFIPSQMKNVPNIAQNKTNFEEFCQELDELHNVAVNTQKSMLINNGVLREILIIVTKNTPKLGLYINQYGDEQRLAVLLCQIDESKSEFNSLANRFPLKKQQILPAKMFHSQQHIATYTALQDDKNELQIQNQKSNGNKAINQQTVQFQIQKQNSEKEIQELMQSLHMIDNSIQETVLHQQEDKRNQHKLLQHAEDQLACVQGYYEAQKQQKEYQETQLNALLKHNNKVYEAKIRNLKSQLNDQYHDFVQEQYKLTGVDIDFTEELQEKSYQLIKLHDELQSKMSYMKEKLAECKGKSEEFETWKGVQIEELDVLAVKCRSVTESIELNLHQTENEEAKLNVVEQQHASMQLCAMCAQNTASVLNLPCRHLTMCARCFNVANIKQYFRICLFCRNKIRKFLYVNNNYLEDRKKT